MYLLDADFIISVLFESESTHQEAKRRLEVILENGKPYVLHEVLYEVANVISRKYSQQKAVEIIPLISKKLLTLDISEKQRNSTWKLFYKQKKKGTSIIDCMNVIVAQELKLEIVSFDTFYKRFEV